jgi:hypothetical protein
MSATVQTKLVKPVPVTRRIVIYVTLALVAFLLGFVPMWLKSMDTSRSLVERESQVSLAQNQIKLLGLQTTLDSAVIEAQRANYEVARVAASKFFTSLRTETDLGAQSALSAAQIQAVQPILAQQDAIITLLARGDSASAKQLVDIYHSYLAIVSK